MSKDYHSLWLNSAALARAEGELQVPGGVVERDERGEPTGVLREECAWHFRDTYVRPTEDEMVDACREAIPLALSRGVVSVHDKDGWLGALRVFQRLKDEGVLDLRIWQSLPWDHLDRLQEIGLASGLGDDFLRVGYIKAFLDGTLGSRTALMLDGSGVEIVGYEEFVDIVRRSARAGFPVAVHAIGDLANRRALDAFEETQDEWRPRGLRPRIEHAQLLAPEDVGRFAKLGVAASVQFSHAASDRDLADAFWEGKTDGAYAFRSLVDSGALVANGSDAPVEELDPLFGIRAGVTRTLDDRDAWHPEQAVTVEQALHATCVAPAWLTGDERRRGKLLPGYLADLVVLDRDPLETPADELGEIQVVATMVGGRWVHRPPPWDLERVSGPAGRPGYNAHMRTMKPVHDEECAVACTADIIGSKWTAIIVHDLSEGPRRFSELERSCPGISPRTLSERLRVLEHDGIIEKHASARRAEYELTEKGTALLPIIDEMSRFGHAWLVDDESAHARPRRQARRPGDLENS